MTPSPALTDPARLAALRRSRLLDTPSEESFDRLTRLAATALKIPIALVSLVDTDRQVFKSCLGLPEPWASERETPISHSFCRHVLDSYEPLIIEDARVHPLVQDNPAIDDMGVIAYAGIAPSPQTVMCSARSARSTRSRAWTGEEIAMLTDLAGAVAAHIELPGALRDTEEALARVQSALAARDQFLSDASHALCTPLVSLRGRLQLAHRQVNRGVVEHLPEHLEAAQSEAERLDEVVQSLLDAAAQSGSIATDRNVPPPAITGAEAAIAGAARPPGAV